jgi:dihydrofolate reductase
MTVLPAFCNRKVLGGVSMPKLRVQNFAISVDGYGAGPNQDLNNPLGVGGIALHEWAFATSTFRQMLGQDGGTTGTDDEFAARGFNDVGAWILGRNMFGPLRGAWPDSSWRGWWGDNPPYHTPVFVLTNHSRASINMSGGTTFHFVTEGIMPHLKEPWTQRTAATSDWAAESPQSVNFFALDLLTKCTWLFRRSYSVPGKIFSPELTRSNLVINAPSTYLPRIPRTSFLRSVRSLCAAGANVHCGHSPIAALIPEMHRGNGETLPKRSCLQQNVVKFSPIMSASLLDQKTPQFQSHISVSG